MTRSADPTSHQTPAEDPDSSSTPTDQAEPHAEVAGWRPLTWTYLVTLFVIYLMLLVWIVLWKLEPPWIGGYRVIKLVPFAATSEAGASTPLDVIANLVLFIPFGIYLGLLAPSRPWWKSAGVLTLASLALEVTQYVLAVGRSDITDVIVNTVGGLAGLALLALVHSKVHARIVRVMNLLCSLGTALALLATGLFIVTPIHIVHVRDVGPSAPAAAPSGR